MTLLIASALFALALLAGGGAVVLAFGDARGGNRTAAGEANTSTASSLAAERPEQATAAPAADSPMTDGKASGARVPASQDDASRNAQPRSLGAELRTLQHQTVQLEQRLAGLIKLVDADHAQGSDEFENMEQARSTQVA